MANIKNPTQWRPASGLGQVVSTGSPYITTKNGTFIVTKNTTFIIANASEVLPKTPTTWTRTGKTSTSWRPATVVTVGNLPLVANTLLPLVDNTVNHFPIVTTPSYVQPKAPTKWTASGI